MLIRQSELYTYTECPRKYLNKSADKRSGYQHSIHSLGGTIVGNAIDYILRLQDMSTMALLKIMVAGEMEVGKVPASLNGDLPKMLERAEAIVDGWRDWWLTSGLTVLGSEVEFRAPYREHELGGRIDALVLDRAGRIGELDWKTYGAWGDSIKAPTLDLKRDLQGSFYCLAMSQPSCEYFANVSLADRDTPTEELRKKHRSLTIGVQPEFYAIALVTELIPYKTGDRKGQPRGDVLYTSDRNRGAEEHAADIVDEFCAAHTMNLFPRHNAKLFGRAHCDNCYFSSRCWPTTESPVRTPIPSFVKGL